MAYILIILILAAMMTTTIIGFVDWEITMPKLLFNTYSNKYLNCFLLDIKQDGFSKFINSDGILIPTIIAFAFLWIFIIIGIIMVPIVYFAPPDEF